VGARRGKERRGEERRGEERRGEERRGEERRGEDKRGYESPAPTLKTNLEAQDAGVRFRFDPDREANQLIADVCPRRHRNQAARGGGAANARTRQGARTARATYVSVRTPHLTTAETTVPRKGPGKTLAQATVGTNPFRT
jgi:hypothetical protein